MDKYDFFESFSGLDADLLERSEQTRRPRAVWTRWAAAAACFAAVAAAAMAVPGLVRDPGAGVEPGQTANVSEPGADVTVSAARDPLDTGPAVSLDVSPVAPPELVFNHVTEQTGPFANPIAGFCIFGEELTDGELAAAAPDVLPRNVDPAGGVQYWEVTGSAGYYGWGELEGVHLDFIDPEWGGRVSVVLRKPDARVYADVMLEDPETVTSRLGPLEYTAYRWEGYGGVLMWAEFRIGDVAYTAGVNADPEDAELAERDLRMVLTCYQGRALSGSAPDLDAYHRKETRGYSDS